MKIIPYTAITGGYEPPRTDIKCFTGEGLFVNPVMEAKIYKILPHKFLDCDVSVWMDGNISLNIPVEQLVEEWLTDKIDIALFKHPERVNIFEEFKVLKEQPRLRNNEKLMSRLDEQRDRYRRTIYTPPLCECGVMIRRHSERMKSFNNMWWSEICRWTERDQVSFPIVELYYSFRFNHPDNILVKRIEGNVRNHPYFTYHRAH